MDEHTKSRMLERSSTFQINARFCTRVPLLASATIMHEYLAGTTYNPASYPLATPLLSSKIVLYPPR